MPLLQVGDIELYYESHGSGDPLVLIGGLGLTVAEMRPLIGALAAGYRVIAADNRGAGRSAKPPGPYTIETHSADALAVLDHFRIDRAWAVGHSWGGHLALHLAVAHPDRLLGVIAVDPLGAYGGEV